MDEPSTCPFSNACTSNFDNPWEEDSKTIVDWVLEGNYLKAEEALKSRVDPNTAFPGGWKIIHGAVLRYDTDILKLLIAHGAYVDAVDLNNATPLSYAASFGALECCQILVEAGADLESQTIDSINHVSKIPVYSGGGRTPLMKAIQNSEVEVVKYLLSKGASKKIEDLDGRNAYQLACRKKGMLCASAIEPSVPEHLFIQEPVDLIHQIKHRIELRDKEKMRKYKETLLNGYTRKFPEIYEFKKEFLVPSFLNAVQKGTKEDLLSILQEISPNIFKFETFTKEFCFKLISELDNFERIATKELKVAVRRPNSMNNYGLILDDIGFSPFIDTLVKKYLSPFMASLFPNNYGPDIDSFHCFSVRYKMGEDLNLALHVDDSEVTFNVCLGKEFTGGLLNFYGQKGEPNEKREEFSYEHEIGTGILHSGTHWHEATKIESGERDNLILWCRSSKVNKIRRS